MTLAAPVDEVVNANDPAQRYVLWGNGRVDPYGGALPITDGPRWFDRTDQPVGVAIHVTDWEGPSGYILDVQGGFQSFGDAPDVMTTVDQRLVNTLGIVYVDNRRYVGWSWNPNGSGEGYCIDYYGQLFPFGGATVPERAGPRFSTPAVKGFAMQWSPAKRAVTLDLHGGLHGDWGVTFGSPPAPYFRGRDVARDLVVTAWAPARGYVLTGDGAAHPWGGAPSSLFGGPYRAGQDVARLLSVLNAEDPTRLWQVHSGGQSFEYVASDPPTVIAGGEVTMSPAATVTTTTRPVLAFAYSDPQQDSLARWEMLVFAQTFVAGRDMSDPARWASSALVNESGTNPSDRGIPSPIDFPNGAFREYVRAQDTAGQWSAWDDYGWAQNVAVPATPTGLTAVADEDTFSVALSVATAAGAQSVRFDYSDDGGATWAPVLGADAVPRAAVTTAVDRGIGLGVPRRYRAVAFSTDPRTASLPSGTATATVTRRTYVLTSTADPSLGGEVIVVATPGWSRRAEAGVFDTLGDEFPTVVSDGRPKSQRFVLGIETDRREQWEMVAAVVVAGGTLLLRDPFGEVVYCRHVGDWSREQQREVPHAWEDTPLRHSHLVHIALVQVAPPTAAT